MRIRIDPMIPRPIPALLLAMMLIASGAEAPAPLGLGQVVILVGPPGSGKTVQAIRLSKKYKVPAISVAELIKEGMVREGKTTGDLAASIASGELLDDQATIQLIDGRVGRSDAGKGFILDGYPATEAQAKFLDDFIRRHTLQLPKVVVLDAPDEVVRERLRKRKRVDDTPENIERRIKQYHEEEKFLQTWYRPENTVRIDANRPIEQVFQEIEEGLVNLFAKRAFKAR
jgi:adenylate kinase